MKWCIFHIPSCIKAQGHANIAERDANTIFPSSTYNGKGDAFRHCYWNARMTIDMGASTARSIGDNHESGNNKPKEKEMDLANNAAGRSIGAGAAGTTDSARYSNAKNTCQARAASGALKTLY